VSSVDAKLVAAKRPSAIKQFSKQIGEDTGFLLKQPLLFEVDPASSYEKAVKDFVEEFSTGTVFVFAQRSGRVYKVLSECESVKFFALSTSVSYPKHSDRANEHLVPQGDSSIYLELLSNTLESSEGNPVAFVFDSISDMIISSGFPTTYKFLKSALGLFGPNATCMFMFMPAVQDPKVTAAIRSLFSCHVSCDSSNSVKLAKKP